MVILVLFVLFMALWSVVGAVVGLTLYVDGTLPSKDPFKQSVARLVCGPIAWAVWAGVRGFRKLETWLKE